MPGGGVEGVGGAHAASLRRAVSCLLGELGSRGAWGEDWRGEGAFDGTEGRGHLRGRWAYKGFFGCIRGSRGPDGRLRAGRGGGWEVGQDERGPRKLGLLGTITNGDKGPDGMARDGPQVDHRLREH